MFQQLKKIFSSAVSGDKFKIDASNSSKPGRESQFTSDHVTQTTPLKSEGNLLLAQGKFDEAATCYLNAVAIDPSDIKGHINLGYVFGEMKRYRDAEYHLKQAIRLDSSNADSLFMLGNLYQEQGQQDDMREHFVKVLALEPDYEIAYRVLLSLRRHEEALVRCDSILRLKPEYVDAIINRGIVLQAMSRPQEALVDFKRALKLRPNDAVLHFHLASALNGIGETEAAAISYRTAISLDPNYADAQNNLGLILLQLKRYEEALDCFNNAIRIKSDNADAFGNRGTALHHLNRFEEALESCARALALRPKSAGSLVNYGVALKNLQRIEEAIACYQHAIQLEPDFADPHYNMALCWLLLGDFERGWERHEWRWQTTPLAKAQRHFVQPLWIGKEALNGKTILLHAEQGFGDTIHFCRYAKLVAGQGANVLLLVPRALISLLTGLEGVHKIIAEGQSLPAFDFHCPLLSLPLAFGTTLQTIPAEAPYLTANTELVSRIRHELGADEHLKIGLCWKGASAYIADSARSPGVAPFQNLISRFKDDEVRFYTLLPDSRDLFTRIGGEDLGHEVDCNTAPFEETAALIMNLDLVITCDTSVGHIAGALGKPVWLVVPFSPDWRWIRGRDNSPWYPNTRLFRQATPGDWDELFDRVAVRLKDVLVGSSILAWPIDPDHAILFDAAGELGA